MLAVVSAKINYANQAIIGKCREADSRGSRTLGMVTKPDYLREVSTDQVKWMVWCRTATSHCSLCGTLKNRSEEDADSTPAVRNERETQFFENGAYRHLPQESKGIAPLRVRLAQVLHGHLKYELPKLQTEPGQKLQETRARLETLGEKRSTVAQQRRFLVLASTAYQKIVTDAADGHFESTFFGDIDTSKAVDHPANMKRLRAGIQTLNHQFASQMQQYGQRYRIWATDATAGTDLKGDFDKSTLKPPYSQAHTLQVIKTREAAVQWVEGVLVRSRGRELRGNFNSILMGQLFREQSLNWETLALDHLENVNEFCKEFVRLAVGAVVDEDLSEKIYGFKLNAVLTQSRDLVTNAIKDAYTSATSNADEALNSQLDYYKCKVSNFIANVTEQIIERHLLHDLAAQTLSPLIINEMDETEIELIAAEECAFTQRREQLEGQKKMLESGQKALDTCGVFGAGVKRYGDGEAEEAGVKRVKV